MLYRVRKVKSFLGAWYIKYFILRRARRAHVGRYIVSCKTRLITGKRSFQGRPLAAVHVLINIHGDFRESPEKKKIIIITLVLSIKV